MNPAERVARLAALLDGTSIGQLDLTGGGEAIRLRRDPAAPAMGVAPAADGRAAASLGASLGARPGAAVAAPSVGVFRARHPSLAAPSAEPGRTVAAGEAVGFIEVGLLLLHVTAPRGGTVAEVLAADGGTVGYGTPLIRLETS